MRATDRTQHTPLALPSSGLAGPAVREAARQYVRDGEPLATFLGDLEVAYQVLNLPPPSLDLVKQASIAWADEFLGKLDGLACEDPLTGMSSAQHARVHLQSLYRSCADRGEHPDDAHALVIVSLVEACPTPEADVLEAAFHQSLRLATISDTLRSTFARCDVVAALDHGRVLAVVSRDDSLAHRADELAWLLRRRLPVSSAPRVLVEPMPVAADQALALLDDLNA
ncbi:hypothetical protein [Nocardioides marmorisolisilvae]|uniref:GGDEF domain-containing protein n=1 Tax=Nocardioides marmorisolisilvae TaxID=1542737 RepID=A0A3N0DSE9_9ACTN|nr:hypothetical protein [Nocardioides marmorisolisilvae]RNL78441.1 hypothetical protein EFL95_04910 [Nocardioides marmorisolisilvae]